MLEGVIDGMLVACSNTSSIGQPLAKQSKFVLVNPKDNPAKHLTVTREFYKHNKHKYKYSGMLMLTVGELLQTHHKYRISMGCESSGKFWAQSAYTKNKKQTNITTHHDKNPAMAVFKVIMDVSNYKEVK
jgi:hypothetical protein